MDEDCYPSLEDFRCDVQKIFDNCRTYNAEGTSYAKCANRLEKYFIQRYKVWTENGNGEEGSGRE